MADFIIAVPKLPVRAQEHQIIREFALEAGGTGNFLVMGARLGMEVKAIGTVGNDYYGAQVLQRLAAEGVDLRHVVTLLNTQTSKSLVLIDDRGEHVFLGAFESGEQLSFDPEWRRVIEKADALFTTGYALHPSAPLSPASVITCLEMAHDCGIPVFFDMAPVDYHGSEAQLNHAIRHTTVFLSTRDEMRSWMGTDDLARATRRILERGPAMAIIKLGDQGCQIATAERQVQVEAFQVAVRDTAGAGDAFDAACVYGCLKGFSLERIGTLANAVGAATVTRLGTGTRLPQRSEIESLLQNSPVDLRG